MQITAPITLLAIAWQGQPSAAWLAQEINALDPLISAETVPGTHALMQVETCPPDVLLMAFDLQQPEHTWHLLGAVARLSPGTRVLLLCEDCSTPRLLEFIRHEASGCLLSATPAMLFAKAVRAVHEGQTWFGRSDLVQALRSAVGLAPAGLQIEAEQEALLTAREREILRLIGAAMSNKEIARKLGISTATVKTHLHHIYVKLQKSGRYKALLSQEANAPLPNGVITRSPKDFSARL